MFVCTLFGPHNANLRSVMPRLSALRDSGLVLDYLYSQELCTPSRAALLTGRIPAKFGLQYGTPTIFDLTGLPLGETLFTELLRGGGYSTHLLGKWHLGRVDDVIPIIYYSIMSIIFLSLLRITFFLGHFSPPYLPTARGFDTHVGFLSGGEDYFTKIAEFGDIYDFIEANSTCYRPYNGSDRLNYSSYISSRTSSSLGIEES